MNNNQKTKVRNISILSIVAAILLIVKECMYLNFWESMVKLGFVYTLTDVYIAIVIWFIVAIAIGMNSDSFMLLSLVAAALVEIRSCVEAVGYGGFSMQNTSLISLFNILAIVYLMLLILWQKNRKYSLVIQKTWFVPAALFLITDILKIIILYSMRLRSYLQVLQNGSAGLYFAIIFVLVGIWIRNSEIEYTKKNPNVA